jgi:asparagine synthase (glutamine-hydrolysing)
MSAILGVFYLDGRPAEEATLKRMVTTLSHRGPDGSGVWLNESIGLGHLMLWTTPESTKEQLPWADPASGLVITSDARIDNRDELLGLFHSRAALREEVSDSYLILRAYERWGAACVEKLVGDYAFCIWNPHEQRLFCARDPFATKHFYYYHRPGVAFAFASEIKALLTLPFIPKEVNELAIAYHLLPIYDDKVTTFYKNILRLPASACVSVDRSKMTFLPSWKPDLSRELRLRSDDEYAEAFRELFEEAVRCRLRSRFPVGSMLSGGLDSSSITSMAGRLLARQGNGPLKTFSAVWPSLAPAHPKIDERRFMQAVIDQGGFEPHFLHLDRMSPLADWETICWHEDQALSAPNMYMDWAIFKAARENGVRVLLGGTDGDTVVTYGYQDLAALVRRGQWIKLLREAHKLSRNRQQRSHSLKRLVWVHGILPTLLELRQHLSRALHQKPTSGVGEDLLREYLTARPLSHEFARRIGLNGHIANLFKDVSPQFRISRKSHWEDISSGNWAYILESFEKAAAAHCVEVRYPFFDQRLVQFCIALPPGQRLFDGYTRSILRRAMNNVLPREVQWRVDKGSLGAGVCVKLLEYERDRLEELVSGRGPIGDYLDVAALRVSYQRYVSNPTSSEREAFWLMLAANLGLWLTTVASESPPTRPEGGAVDIRMPSDTSEEAAVTSH